MNRIYKVFFVTITFFSCQNNPSATAPSAVERKIFHVRKMNTPTWSRSASMYEVNVRHFSKEGTFKALQEDLPRIRDLGISTICLLPIYPIGLDKRKGTLGNPHSIADFTKVNPELGSFEDLKSLVAEIHRLHMHVIMDWISNHTAWDHTWVNTHPEWYVQDGGNIVSPKDGTEELGFYEDVAELNFEVEAMRHTMIESMKFWLRAIDVDGFRCQTAHLVPNDYWTEVRPALETIKPVLMIANSVGEANHFETCFQATSGLELYRLVNAIAQQNADGNDIAKLLTTHRANNPQGYYHFNFTSTSLENALRGSASERLGAAHKALTVIAMTHEGMPLILNGQEYGFNRSLSLYDKDQITRNESSDFIDFYKRLIFLKKHNKALWNGTAGGALHQLNDDPQVYAYLRTHEENTVVTLVNCSDQPVKTSINRDLRSLTELFTGKDYHLKNGSEISLQPWEYLVLSNPSIIL